MGLVIQKYGGTSLGDVSKISHAAQRIAAADGSVAVVVSAMGGTTDAMLELARDLTDNPHARELDILLSTGEQASAAALAMALHELGVPARSFNARDGGIITDGVHGCARIVNVHPEQIRECIQAGYVPVVTGFQGIAAESGELTTLSRGGSDTTAVALAAALRAEVCEIFTDVEGVFTADPRYVAEARKLSHLSYEDMAELAAGGATVLAHSSVQYAGTHRVPLHVRSSTTETTGTWVTGSRSTIPPDGERFTAVGVAHRTGQLRCRLDGVVPTALTTVAAMLADPALSVDMLDHLAADGSGHSLRFVVKATDQDQVNGVLADLRAAGAFGECHWSGPVGKVSLVGHGFCARHPQVRLLPGALATHGVTVRDMTVRTRRISITCAEYEVLNAVRRLHRMFLSTDTHTDPYSHAGRSPGGTHADLSSYPDRSPRDTHAAPYSHAGHPARGTPHARAEAPAGTGEIRDTTAQEPAQPHLLESPARWSAETKGG
ncbi:aspartate kinase [Streptosporangium sp. NPDC000563]|uniref:aspartate kinase n=1 Tax=Streptosporangium sp. NPDC000563 TaxID=3154366 RepID=UPI00332145F7